MSKRLSLARGQCDMAYTMAFCQLALNLEV